MALRPLPPDEWERLAPGAWVWVSWHGQRRSPYRVVRNRYGELCVAVPVTRFEPLASAVGIWLEEPSP
jgi:hypothetical protein